MILEGTQQDADIPKARIGITITNTNVRELARLYTIIQTMFDNGVFNVRNGKMILHFNDEGELKGGDIEARKWMDGKQVISRVAVFDSAIVEIISNVVE